MDRESQEQLVGSWDKSRQRVLGFPNNLGVDFSEISHLFGSPLINGGDPYEGFARYRRHSLDTERAVVDYFAEVYGWKSSSSRNHWGYITGGSTEAIMHAIATARDRVPKPILYCSDATHFSVKKIANLLSIPLKLIPSFDGVIDPDAFIAALDRKKFGAIVVANVGTTFNGSTDDIGLLKDILEKRDVPHYIHADAALHGGFIHYSPMLPEFAFVRDIPDSMNISGHKFFGTPMPCGILLHRDKCKIKGKKIDYIGATDSTISGCRNGHSALALFHSAIVQRQQRGHEYSVCRALASDLVARMQGSSYGIGNRGRVKMRESFGKVDHFPSCKGSSLIVTFDSPSEEIIQRYQLSVSGSKSHLVVLPQGIGCDLEVFAEFERDYRRCLSARSC